MSLLFDIFRHWKLREMAHHWRQQLQQLADLIFVDVFACSDAQKLGLSVEFQRRLEAEQTCQHGSLLCFQGLHGLRVPSVGLVTCNVFHQFHGQCPGGVVGMRRPLKEETASQPLFVQTDVIDVERTTAAAFDAVACYCMRWPSSATSPVIHQQNPQRT